MYGSVKSQFSDCRELFAMVGRTIMASTIVALAVYHIKGDIFYLSIFSIYGYEYKTRVSYIW